MFFLQIQIQAHFPVVTFVFQCGAILHLAAVNCLLFDPFICWKLIHNVPAQLPPPSSTMLSFFFSISVFTLTFSSTFLSTTLSATSTFPLSLLFTPGLFSSVTVAEDESDVVQVKDYSTQLNASVSLFVFLAFLQRWRWRTTSSRTTMWVPPTPRSSPSLGETKRKRNSVW